MQLTYLTNQKHFFNLFIAFTASISLYRLLELRLYELFFEMIPLGAGGGSVAALIKNVFFAMERVSAFLNTRHGSNTFPDIPHYSYKNLINDIDEDISAVV